MNGLTAADSLLVPIQCEYYALEGVTELFDTLARLRRELNPGLAIEGMTGFVSNVELADGAVWIPSRSDLSDPRLQKVITSSAEEQRLVQLYRKRGLIALTDELKKF